MLEERYKAVLALPRNQLKKLDDFLKRAYNDDGVPKDIPHKDDLDFLDKLTPKETEHLLNLADLKGELRRGLIKLEQFTEGKK